MRILIFLLLLPLSAYAGMMSFSVSPSIVKFETVQGGIKTFDLSFFNQGENTIRVDVKLMDLRLDAKGVPIISELSKNKPQWARFVSLNKTKFTVGAKQYEKIHVTLNTPRGRVGGGYFAIVFNTNAPKSSKKSKHKQNLMTIGGQLPALFIGEVSRTGKRKAQIIKSAINKAPYTQDKPLKMRFVLKNTGTTHVNVSGDVLLRYNNKVIGRLMLESGSGLILPQGERYFVASWDKFSKYSNKTIKAEARFSYQGGRANKKITFKIP